MKKIKNFIELKYIEVVYETDKDLLFIVDFIPNTRPWVNVKVYKNNLEERNASFDVYVLPMHKGKSDTKVSYHSSYRSLKKALKIAGQLAVKMNKLDSNRRVTKWLEEFFELIESKEADHSNDFSSEFSSIFRD